MSSMWVLEMILVMNIDYVMSARSFVKLLLFVAHTHTHTHRLQRMMFAIVIVERISTVLRTPNKLKEPWLFQINEVLSWISIHNETKRTNAKVRAFRVFYPVSWQTSRTLKS